MALHRRSSSRSSASGLSQPSADACASNPVSRLFERAFLDPGLASLTDLLTVPGGHKFELLSAGCYADGTHAYLWQFFVHHGAAYSLVDEVSVPAGAFARLTNWSGIVLEPGDSIVAYVTSTGTFHTVAYWGYIDVDFST